MENRDSIRETVRLETELISDSISFKGYIRNLSDVGINMVTEPGGGSALMVLPGKSVELKIYLLPTGIIDLKCRVVWSYKSPPQGLSVSLGMEIMDSPDEYREFLSTLNNP